MNFEDVLEIFDAVSSEECRSILKSNSFKRRERELLNFKVAQKIIEEFLPTVYLVGIGSIIMDLLDTELKKTR